MNGELIRPVQKEAVKLRCVAAINHPLGPFCDLFLNIMYKEVPMIQPLGLAGQERLL